MKRLTIPASVGLSMVCKRGVIPKEILQVGASFDGGNQSDAIALSSHLSEAVGSATCSCCNLHCEEHLAKMLHLINLKGKNQASLCVEEKNGSKKIAQSLPSIVSSPSSISSNQLGKERKAFTEEHQAEWHTNVQVALESAFYAWFYIKEYRSKLNKVKAEQYILKFESKLSDAREELDTALSTLVRQKAIMSPAKEESSGTAATAERSNEKSILAIESKEDIIEGQSQTHTQEGVDDVALPVSDSVVAAVGLIDVLLHVANEASPGGTIYDEAGGVEQLLDQTVLDALSSDILRERFFIDVCGECIALFLLPTQQYDLNYCSCQKAMSKPMEIQKGVKWQRT